MIYAIGLLARIWCVAFVCFAGAFPPTAVTISTFNDKNAFLTATGATSATGPLPFINSLTTSPITVGSVTFTRGPRARDFFMRDWSARLPGNELIISDYEDLNMVLAAPVYALGFDFVEPKNDPNINATFVDSTFTVSLLNNGVLVDSFTFNAPEDTAYFIGVSSNTPFNRVEIRETVGHWENEFFGQVYTSATPIPNQPPIANAGADQSVHPGNLATLDGSGSSDPDGNTPLSYAWQFSSKPAGSAATLTNSNSVSPSFTPDLPGNYTVTLVVTDSLGLASAPDQVLVSTSNTPPVANAGPDQVILTLGTTVNLDGRQSYDNDGDPFTYQWTMTAKPSGSAATLSGASTATPSFVADVNGDYLISLVVTDSIGAASAADSVMVSFNNVKPVANAGVNQSAVVGNLVTLNGGGSSDANLDPLAYRWSIASAPVGSAAALNGQTSVQPSFVPDLAGTYIISLVVNDGFVDSDASNVTVTAISAPTTVTQKVSEIISVINGLDPGVFKNANMKNALTNKLNAVLELVNQGRYSDALDKLQNDIRQKTDGCANAGAPDNNDWINVCAAQQQVHPKITEAIVLLNNLV